MVLASAAWRSTARIVTLELAETFVISRGARDTEDAVLVEIRHSGVAGYGEAAPIERYDESAASALAYVEEHAAALGHDPSRSRRRWRGCRPGSSQPAPRSTRALHDLQGKLLGQPVWRLLGLRRAGPPTTGRSGSATPTTWRAAPRRCAAASGG